MEVYIDDMLVKSAFSPSHLDHLQQCFDILNEFGMKLNPSKCTFAVPSGEFLGYIVTERGIEANPRQTNAFLSMSSPRTISVSIFTRCFGKQIRGSCGTSVVKRRSAS